MGKSIYVLVSDGFADWEPAHALAELRRSGGFRVVTVGFTREPIESMGGLRVLPDVALDAVDPEDVALLIVPGGDRWESASSPEPELAALLRRLETRHVPVAAICGATVALARAGLLRERRHTSNGSQYLQQQAPGQTRAANYVDAPAVRDRGVITASGAGDVEFAREIFEELGVFNDADRALWTEIFRSGRLPSEQA
jgi:putative intracellular protease/amidase